MYTAIFTFDATSTEQIVDAIEAIVADEITQHLPQVVGVLIALVIIGIIIKSVRR